MQRRRIGIALSVLVLLAAGIIGLVYYVIRDTSKDASLTEPYAAVLNRPLITRKELILARNLPEFVVEAPNLLSESKEVFEGVEVISVLPVGTEVVFEKALQVKGGVSGFSSGWLIGKVIPAGTTKAVSVEYRWGEKHDICLEDPCGYWTFPQAFWQTTPDLRKYFLD